MIQEADAIILPGVGAFRDAITNIKDLKQSIIENIDLGKPILGICLGLQLMFTESTERGSYPGLDLFKGKIIRLPEAVKIPHIGWNSIRLIDVDNPLLEGIEDNSYFYFVHSYYASGYDSKNIIAETEYGVTFPSIIGAKHVLATQFHPEKSGSNGLKILYNFIKLIKGV